MSNRAVPPGEASLVVDDVVADQDGPLTLRLAVLMLWIESAALGVLSVFALGSLVNVEGSFQLAHLILFLIPPGAAVFLAQLGRWLTYRRAWARGPAVVTQLMVIPVAYFMLQVDVTVTRVIGVVLGLFVLTCAGLLLAPSSRGGLMKSSGDSTP